MVDVPKCPRCDRGMVLRTARKGARAGSQFWGCSTYPQCEGTRKYIDSRSAQARREAQVGAASQSSTSDERFEGFVPRCRSGCPVHVASEGLANSLRRARVDWSRQHHIDLPQAWVEDRVRDGRGFSTVDRPQRHSCPVKLLGGERPTPAVPRMRILCACWA